VGLRISELDRIRDLLCHGLSSVNPVFHVLHVPRLHIPQTECDMSNPVMLAELFPQLLVMGVVLGVSMGVIKLIQLVKRSTQSTPSEGTVICARCGCRTALDSYCCECGSPLARVSDPVPNVAETTSGGPAPITPVRARKASGAIIRKVVLGLLLIVVTIAGVFVYIVTRPDPNGYKGFDPSASPWALYYMRKGVRGIAADQGLRNIAFCDGGTVVKPGAFVYLIDSCFEYGPLGDGRVRVPFFVQMERIPPDGGTYSVVQFKAGQSAVVRPPQIADARGLTPPTLPPAILGTTYSQYLFAVGGYTLRNFNSVSTEANYGWFPKGTLPPGLTGHTAMSPCIQQDMENCAFLLSGTPTQAGQFTFSVEVADWASKNSDGTYRVGRANITITVNPSPESSDMPNAPPGVFAGDGIKDGVVPAYPSTVTATLAKHCSEVVRGVAPGAEPEMNCPFRTLSGEEFSVDNPNEPFERFQEKPGAVYILYWRNMPDRSGGSTWFLQAELLPQN
jgi:hypothetical protein